MIIVSKDKPCKIYFPVSLCGEMISEYFFNESSIDSENLTGFTENMAIFKFIFLAVKMLYIIRLLPHYF